MLIGSVLLLIIGSAVLLSCQREGFIGRRVKNADVYLLDMEQMTGTDLHMMELQTGDVLHIRFETKQGSLHMEIKAPDGTSVYRGNGRETTEFTVNITESGVYVIAVEARRGRHHWGSA